MKIAATLATLALSISLTVGAPQGLLNGLSNLLTGVVGGGGNAGEVDNYQNARYSVVQKFDVSQDLSIGVLPAYLRCSEVIGRVEIVGGVH